jgi:predicted molibdopterin-dependent oxidoreductase YjgC
VLEPGTLRECGDDECARESRRCLRCDCRASCDCRLREYAARYGASPRRFGSERRPYVHDVSHPQIVYEPGKCIACGLCLQIAAKHAEPLGQTFLGRGFAVRVGPPFGARIAEALSVAGAACVEACPTGALSWKDGHARDGT